MCKFWFKWPNRSFPLVSVRNNSTWWLVFRRVQSILRSPISLGGHPSHAIWSRSLPSTTLAAFSTVMLPSLWAWLMFYMQSLTSSRCWLYTWSWTRLAYFIRPPRLVPMRARQTGFLKICKRVSSFLTREPGKLYFSIKQWKIYPLNKMTVAVWALRLRLRLHELTLLSYWRPRTSNSSR